MRRHVRLPVHLAPQRIAALLATAMIAFAAPTTAGAVSVSRSLDASRDASAARATDLLPDLRMALLTDMQVHLGAGGHTLLRFTTIQMNIGRGPFEVRGHRAPTDKYMSTKQRIYASDGSFRDVPTKAFAFYAGDGHDHWHIARMQTQQLWPKSDPTGPFLRGSKVGFCFFDNAEMRPQLHGHPAVPVYTGCGHADSTKITVGLSVGWGDVYPWDIAYQYIDVAGVPTGDYRVCVTVDSKGLFTESDTTNDQVWADVHLDMDDTANPVVSTIAAAWSSCR